MSKLCSYKEYSHLVLGRSALANMVAGLPGMDLVDKLGGEADYYGASSLISNQLGLLETPPSPAKWSHGWKFQQIDFLHELGDYKHKERNHLVARTEHRDVLVQAGFSNVHVVGMPFIYTSDYQVKEPMPNSLLVCPGHVGNFTKADWQVFSKNYAAKIAALKDQFDEILVCLSASCVESGNWTEAFESHGIPWVMGASIYDRNALPRMRQLFSSFAYMTTNTIGSHLPYAAYSGCRVSIFHWQNLYTKEMLSAEPYYQKYPEVLEKNLNYMNEESLRERFPDLFVGAPQDASNMRDWAADQLGEQYQKDPQIIAELLGWKDEAYDKLGAKTFKAPIKLKHLGPSPKGLAGSIKKRLWKKERSALKSLTRFAPGYVELFGRPFRYVDARSAMHAIDHIFNKEVYAFEPKTESPLIIDAGANVGLGTLYFKRRFPKARVVCFEPDPQVFSALSRNAQTYEWSDCELIRSALWKEDGVTEFISEGSDAGAVDLGQDNEGKRFLVPASPLSTWLKKGPVDFLKIDIEGAEVDVLEECADQLSNVQRIFVEYHSFEGKPQHLGDMLQLLEHSGFRIHINYAGLSSSQPLVQMKTYCGMDQQLDVYAFR